MADLYLQTVAPHGPSDIVLHTSAVAGTSATPLRTSPPLRRVWRAVNGGRAVLRLDKLDLHADGATESVERGTVHVAVRLSGDAPVLSGVASRSLTSPPLATRGPVLVGHPARRKPRLLARCGDITRFRVPTAEQIRQEEQMLLLAVAVSADSD